MYARIKEHYTHLGCKVVEVQSVARKEYPDEGGEVLTPRLDIFLSVPEKELDKPNDVA